MRSSCTPCAHLCATFVDTTSLAVTLLGRARVKWEMPKTVMIVTKPGDESLLKITREIAFWMIASRGLTVYVEDKMKDIPKFRYPSFLKSTKLGYDYTPSLKFWTAELCAQEAHLFDFAITLGGDGTVLFTSWLFQQIVPPILPFSAGSLGFLTPFPTTDYQKILSGCLDTGVRVNLRMRFSCTIYRCLEQRTVETTKKKKNRRQRNKNRSHGQNVPQDDSDEDSDSRRRQMPTVLTTPTETFEILNDLVLDRGPSANLSLLELFGDEQHLTTVQADGIVISTPTGSTAYSLAAGGPLSHPEIPAILISPICPHTLSFRPMLLPDSMELRICVPFDSRSTAWASFDGRGRVELKQGDHIKVTASVYPFPTICSNSQSSDWFHSLSRCLRWNERERQKGFTVVEHSSAKRTKKSNSSSNDGAQSSSPTRSHGTQGHQRSRSNADNSLGSSASTSGHIHEHSHSHSHSHSSGSNSGGSSKARQSSPRPGVVSPVERKGSRNSQDYFYESPHDTDTMLTCWGTDSSDSDGDDDEDSDAADDKDEAADGDGEWEAGSSSDDDDDDDNEVKETALGKPSNNEAPSAYGNGSSGEGVAAPKGTIPNLLGSPLGAVEILTNKLNHALLEPELET
ncbi:ATP-NAD kinase-like domain-containing protein [Dissophora ornata]|nr:ATP-NAD kinase-like domain-containing protein [Dissophora ornata]